MWKRFGNVLCYVWKIQRDASSIMIQNIKDYFCEVNTFAIVEMTNNKNCKESTTTHFLIKKIFSGLADNSFIRGKMLKGLVWDKILQLARWQVVETLPLVGGTMDNAVSCLPRCSWPFPLTAAQQIRQHTKTSKRTQTQLQSPKNCNYTSIWVSESGLAESTQNIPIDQNHGSRSGSSLFLFVLLLKIFSQVRL